ncbi:MAG: DUF3576 domain-containing protein [Rickettsiales bacterium]|nr:DUF3576 domain-containing protein [Rickettsiales bacterium]
MIKWIMIATTALFLNGCDVLKGGVNDTPLTPEDAREERRGKLTGSDGWNILGGDGGASESGARLGVNSFLWRATLDTLAFMPFTAADPFGGTVLTDWYEDPNSPGERFKVNALILDSTLRADAIKLTLFKQAIGSEGNWRDIKVSPDLARKLENTILTRARELRVNRLRDES